MLYKTRAIVLGTRSVKESDSIITFFSEDRGKLRAVAKGVRKTKSKFGSRLEPFTLSRLMIYKKGKPPATYKPHEQHSMDIVTDAEIEHSFGSLRENLHGYACGSYYTELVSKMIREGDANNSVFYLLRRFLGITGSPATGRTFFSESGLAASHSVLIFSFTLRLLGLLGYSPQTGECTGCGMKAGEKRFKNHFFSVEFGGILCQKCAGKDSKSFELQRSTMGYLKQLTRMEPEQLRSLRIFDVCRREIEKLISNYLYYHLELELNSTGFLRNIGILMQSN